MTERLEEWKLNNYHARNHVPQQNVQQTQPKAQSMHSNGTDFDLFQAGAFAQNPCSATSLPTHKSRTPTPATAQRTPPELFPLLKTVPKQNGVSYEGACKRCSRKVVVNGNNDGLHCTRCFNKSNREIEFQNGLILSGRSAAPTNTTRTSTMETPAPASYQSDLRNPIMPMINTFGAAPLTPMTPAGAGLPIGTDIASLQVGVPPTTLGTQSLFATNELDDLDAEEDGAETFDLEHGSVEAAREYLIHRPASACQPLNLLDDDLESVKQETFYGLCVELFQVLRTPGAGPPLDFTDNEKNYFNGGHAKIFKAVKREMKTPEQRTMTKARVIVAMHEVVRVHEFGIPKTVFDKSDVKNHRGYEPDLELTCGARARKVVDYARRNKYVALDIVRGKNLDYLAQAPDRYVDRKMANLKTNAVRGEKLQMVKNLEKGKKRKGKGTIKTAQTNQISPDPPVPSDSIILAPRTMSDNHAFPSIQQHVAFDLNPASANAGPADARKRAYESPGEESIHGSMANKRARCEDAFEDEVDGYNL